MNISIEGSCCKCDNDLDDIYSHCEQCGQQLCVPCSEDN